MNCEGSPEKLEFCRSLGADVAINYKEGNWKDKTLEATQGKGVDILIDFIGGPYWQGTSTVILSAIVLN